MKDELVYIIAIVLTVTILLTMACVLNNIKPKVPTCTVTDLVNKEIVVCTYKDKVLFHGEVEK